MSTFNREDHTRETLYGSTVLDLEVLNQLAIICPTCCKKKSIARLSPKVLIGESVSDSTGKCFSFDFAFEFSLMEKIDLDNENLKTDALLL